MRPACDGLKPIIDWQVTIWRMLRMRPWKKLAVIVRPHGLCQEALWSD